MFAESRKLACCCRITLLCIGFEVASWAADFDVTEVVTLLSLIIDDEEIRVCGRFNVSRRYRHYCNYTTARAISIKLRSRFR